MNPCFSPSILLSLAFAILLTAGCASKSPGVENAESATETSPAPEEQNKKAEKEETDKSNIIQGINGFKGEIHGTPATNSKFYALQIGMTVKQVTDILGRLRGAVHTENRSTSAAIERPFNSVTESKEI